MFRYIWKMNYFCNQINYYISSGISNIRMTIRWAFYLNVLMTILLAYIVSVALFNIFDRSMVNWTSAIPHRCDIHRKNEIDGYLKIPKSTELEKMDMNSLLDLFYDYVETRQWMCCYEVRSNRSDGTVESYCLDELNTAEDCYVYSFGITDVFSFERNIYRQLYCITVIFDHRVHNITKVPYGLSIHKLGLAGRSSTGSEMTSLATIRTTVHQIIPFIDVLKLNRGVWGWDTLEIMVSAGELSLVKQILLEIELTKGIDCMRDTNKGDTLTDKLHVQDMLETLGRLYKKGFRIFMSQNQDLRTGKTCVLKLALINMNIYGLQL